ncbi:non-structural maintenance of chromosomes element 1 homolog isoform X1 [Branchiostoma floridae x Branchiostoma japonicum]
MVMIIDLARKTRRGSEEARSLQWEKYQSTVTMATAMTDAHRMFLQSIMTHGALKAREVKALYKKCCETFRRPLEHDNLGKFVNEINHHVGPFSMMIQKGVSEEDGVQYYALVNMMESDITRLASDYTETELEFFKKVLDLIVDSDTGVASSTDVLNLTDQLYEEQNRKMRKKEAEDVIRRMVRDRWLNEHQGEISLSVRGILELKPYLTDHYKEDIRHCCLCEQIALKGQLCQSDSCEAKMHYFCANRYFRDKDQPRCPRCKAEWDHMVVSQGANGHSQTEETPASQTQGRKRKVPSRH